MINMVAISNQNHNNYRQFFYSSHTVVPTISSLSSSAPGNKIILPRTGSTSVTIACTASGDDSFVRFQWTLNGGTVSGSATATNSGNQVIGQLYIYPVRTAHGGTYRCSTSNNVGSDTQELSLAVVGKLGGIEWYGLCTCYFTFMYEYRPRHTGTANQFCTVLELVLTLH